MHVYIYDDYLSKSKYSRAVNRMEIRLTDLGLNGKILRLGGIKNIKTAIENEIRLGAKTIVAVGNNQTVNKIVGAIISADVYDEFQKKTLLGIIPIGEDNSVASSFGIKDEETACNILLARRIEKIDLGIAGNQYFLNQAFINSIGTTIEVNGCKMETEERGEIRIVNLLSDRKEKGNFKSSPYDGMLDIIIKTRKKDVTFLNARSLSISNDKEKLLIDDVLEIKTPVDIHILKGAVSVIVGKERIFS
jgi:diacylglycerol kinase family enzyme